MLIISAADNNIPATTELLADEIVILSVLRVRLVTYKGPREHSLILLPQ